MSQTEEDFAAALQSLSEDFDKLCQERHEAGKKEYGATTFLGNDVIRMMAEELADTANYCRMQFIKIMLLQNMLVEELKDNPDKDGEIAFGINSFKGVGDIGWK